VTPGVGESNQLLDLGPPVLIQHKTDLFGFVTQNETEKLTDFDDIRHGSTSPSLGRRVGRPHPQATDAVRGAKKRPAGPRPAISLFPPTHLCVCRFAPTEWEREIPALIQNPQRLTHSRSKHRSNGRARLLPSVRVVQLGRSLALPFIRPIVFLSMRQPLRVPVSSPSVYRAFLPDPHEDCTPGHRSESIENV
jgi:hypothetical protein